MSKKRLLIINIVSFVIILLLFLGGSLALIFNANNTAKNELKAEAQVITSIYDGSNSENVLTHFNYLHISIYDENQTLITTNKETAPVLTINNLNEIVKTPANFAYLLVDEGHYILIEQEISPLLKGITTAFVVGLIALPLLFAVNIIFLYLTFRNDEKKAAAIIAQVGEVSGKPLLPYRKSRKFLSQKDYDDLGNNIKKQIQQIKEERIKAEFVLDSLNQGVIVLDSYLRISLINRYTLNLYGYSEKQKVIGLPAILLFQNIELQSLIENIFQDEGTNEGEFELSGRKMKAIVHAYFSEEDILPNENAVVILIFDITEERNLSIMKQEFFANASHELKSPLTAIIGYQQMIKSGILKEEEQLKEAIDRTLFEAQRMNQIIIEMLGIAELESDKPREVSEVSVKEVHDEILTSLQTVIQKRNLNIINELDDITLIINPEDARHLFRNLVENAIRYNVEGGSITLKSNKAQNTYSITDTGIGIAPRNKARIFERFYRVDQDRSKEKSGTGLGLAIVKHISQVYNYTVTVESALRRGTTFSIDFSSKNNRRRR